MNNQLTPTDLMRQSVVTSHSYLSSAIRIIDEELGEGYAKAHPELIAGFMKTAATDFHTAIMHQKFDSLICEIFELYRCKGTAMNPEMEIDSHRLETDAFLCAAGFLTGAGESVGALLEYPEGKEIEVMKKCPWLVAAHALIAFIDYELSIKRETLAGGKRNE